MYNYIKINYISTVLKVDETKEWTRYFTKK